MGRSYSCVPVICVQGELPCSIFPCRSPYCIMYHFLSSLEHKRRYLEDALVTFDLHCMDKKSLEHFLKYLLLFSAEESKLEQHEGE